MAERTISFMGTSYEDLRLAIRTVIPGLVKYGTDFNFTPEEVTDFSVKLEDVITKHDDKETATIAAKTATEAFQESQKQGKVLLRSISSRFKSGTKYTTTIGEEVGIIGKETHYEPAEMKPEIKITLKAGVPRIKFVKSFSDGVNIYSKRAEETGYTFLARDESSPYVDDRANKVSGAPETRHYYAVYVFNDEENGFPSDEAKVSV